MNSRLRSAHGHAEGYEERTLADRVVKDDRFG